MFVVVVMFVVVIVAVVVMATVHVDDVMPVVPAPRENGDACDRHGGDDDPGAVELGHAPLQCN
jgi:hypothetical protein